MLRRTASAFAEDAFGNALATEVIKLGNKPQTTSSAKQVNRQVSWDGIGDDPFGAAAPSTTPQPKTETADKAIREAVTTGDANTAVAAKDEAQQSSSGRPPQPEWDPDAAEEIIVTGVRTQADRDWHAANFDSRGNYIGKSGFDYASLSLDKERHLVEGKINSLFATVPSQYKVLGLAADKILNSVSATPEGREVAKLMHNFVTGEGPSEYFYGADSPLTKSMMSTDSTERNWQLFLSENKDQIRSGGTVPPYENGRGAWGLETPNGRDAIKDASFPVIDPTRQFVGSYDVKIHDNGNGTATIKIINETSLTSYTRDFFSAEARIKSFDRVPNNYGLLTPYGTIKQTFTETRSYPQHLFNSPVLSNAKER